MAERPIFVPKENYVEIIDVPFQWHPGFSPIQKQKSINSLHASAKKIGLNTTLEVSTKSEVLVGRSLSAFNLNFELDSFQSTVESIYQGSKKFENGGPYQDIYKNKSLEAKKDLRLKSSGDIVGFVFKKEEWPLSPLKGFYSWVYMKALAQRKNLIFEKIRNFDSFTDIEFNPKKSINCQAFCVACFIVLMKKNNLDEVLNDKKNFLKTISQIDSSNGLGNLDL